MDEYYDCPQDCGALEYKATSSIVREGNKALIGFGLTVIAIITILIYLVRRVFVESPHEFQLILVIIFCVIIFLLGAKIMFADTWNHHCSKCHGVLIDSGKIIEKFHEDDARKILLMMKKTNKISSDLYCPRCKNKMNNITVNYVTKVTSAFAGDYENMLINVCDDCVILWFDDGKIDLLAASLITDK